MTRRYLCVAAVAIAVIAQGPMPVLASPPTAQVTTTVAPAGSGEGSITVKRARDPGTDAPGIFITYYWDSRFGRTFDAKVRLYQDRHLVGRITFLRGGPDARAFFRTSSAPKRHVYRAVGALLHRDGTVVAGSTERSVRTRWRVTVQPGQVTPAR